MAMQMLLLTALITNCQLQYQYREFCYPWKACFIFYNTSQYTSSFAINKYLIKH